MRRRSIEEKCELVDRYRASGMGQAAFCELEKIPVSSLQNWLREANRKSAPNFVQVPLAAESIGEVELSFRDGTRLRIRK